MGLIPIITDGKHFITCLKKYSVDNDKSLPDTVYDYADFMLKVFRQTHDKFVDKFSFIKNPEILYCAFYQDGVMHAYERILALRNTGKYSCQCEFINAFEIYEKLRKEKVKMRRYEDVAYIDGYLLAHMDLFLFIKEPDCTGPMPLFYAYGCKNDLVKPKDYKKILKQIPNMHKGAYINAQRIVKKNRIVGNDVMHHPAHF